MKIHPQNVVISINNNIIHRETKIEEKFCKICYEQDETKSKLLSPCACSGTMGYIHEHCLRIWIEAKKKSITEYRCELCHKKLLVKKLHKEEKCKLPGLHKNCYSYVLDTLCFIVINYDNYFGVLKK